MSRHRFDLASALAAILLSGVAVRYLVQGFGGSLVPYEWAVPGIVIGLIVVSVLHVVFRSHRREP